MKAKKFLNSVSIFLVVGSLSASAVEYHLHRGWNLLGAVCDITPNMLNNSNILTVWRWAGTRWEAYSPNDATQQILESNGFHRFNRIHRLEGFWINANTDFILDIPCVDLPPSPGNNENNNSNNSNGLYVAGDTINHTLTWSGLYDLDTHIVKVTQEGRLVCHVYYGHMSCQEIRLDNDDTSDHGRETSHIRGVDEDYNYIVYIYNFANTAPLGSGNGRQIRICTEYDNNNQCVNAPENNDINKRYWLVYTIRNGRLEFCQDHCIMNASEFRSYLSNNFHLNADFVRSIIETTREGK